ncbi:MAG TPA: hypothetical protein VKF36_12455 [Syntrophorhabdales bacterium]|nr:hypothetical protein [Syntrophorhabdales bacterium]
MHHKALLFTTLMFLLIMAPVFSPASRAQAAREPSVKADEPGSHFQKAVELFVKKDLKAAASEIRKGAGFLKRKAKSATKEGKEGLSASAQELEKLAKDVERGGVTSEKQLKDTFARSYEALSNHEYRRASESWAKKKTRETGQALTNAAADMEQAAKWSGRELETGTADTIDYARAVGGKLIKGAGWTADEVDKGIKGISSALSKFGEKVEPKDK